MTIDVTCPRCNHEFDLLHARDDDDWRWLMEMILTLPPVTHRSMWSYLSLFKGKNKLRSSKMLRIVKELSPLIKAAMVTRERIDYVVTPDTFSRAMEYLVDNPPATLKLPLKGNGYLLSILANNAETALQKAEKKTEQDKRTPYREVDNTNSNTAHASQPAHVSKKMPDDFKRLSGSLSPGLKKKHKDDLNPDQTNIKGD